jgi:hypothetical protein
MERRAAETAGAGPKLALALAHEGITPQAIEARTPYSQHQLRAWFAGAPMPRDAQAAVRAAVAAILADRETS